MEGRLVTRMQLYLQYHHCHQQHFIIIWMKAASKEQKLMSFSDAKSLKNTPAYH